MSFTINWNDGDFQKNIKKIERAFSDPSEHGPVGKGVLLAGQALLRDSQDIVPLDTGDLQKSSSTSKVVRSSKGMQIDIGYNMDYAVKLHEDMQLKIKQTNKSGSGKRRQQKYLELPMKQNGKDYGNIMARAILKYLS